MTRPLKPGDTVAVVYVPHKKRYTATVEPTPPRDTDLIVRLHDTPPTQLFFPRGEVRTRSGSYELVLETSS